MFGDSMFCLVESALHSGVNIGVCTQNRKIGLLREQHLHSTSDLF